MPTLYSSVDAGLPAFAITTTQNQARFNNYKNLLKACLVNGYGSKIAAGWTLIDEGDHYIVLRNASGHYVSFVSGQFYNGTAASFLHMRIYLSATYINMLDGIPQGMGVVSGTSANLSSNHYFGVYYFYAYSSTRWVMLADGDTFVLSITAPSSTAGWGVHTLENNSAACGTLYVGNDLGGNFLSVGGAVQTTVPSGTSVSATLTAMTTLTDPSTGMLVDTNGVSASMSAIVSVSSLSGTDFVDIAELELSRVRWVCAGQVQPGLRGVTQEWQLRNTYAYRIKDSLDGVNSGTADNTNIFQPSGIDGYLYFPLLANYSSRHSVIATSNPEFW
jgi:hypothetical protein